MPDFLFPIVQPDHPSGQAPTMAEPKPERWYHGVTERGTGAIAQYQGWGEFALGDGTLVDMTIYPVLVEQPQRT